MFINLKNVTKSYGSGAERNVILNKVNLDIEKGEICVILGPSGSGKSTLLNVIGGLDDIEGGKVTVGKTEISSLSNKKLTEYRRRYFGYIFQFYNLVPNLSVRENIQVCEYLSKSPLDVDDLIETLGLEEQKDKFPPQISGGQQQRCAIARAVVKNPDVLLCDEPTGALDYKSSKDILCLLERINKKYGTTIIMVTHNTAIQNMATHILEIKDGAIQVNEKNENVMPAKDIEW